jgi:cytochrome c551/c552
MRTPFDMMRTEAGGGGMRIGSLRFAAALCKAVNISLIVTLAAGLFVADGTLAAAWAAECTAERSSPIVPVDPDLCQRLESAVRQPSALSLDQYERRLNEFLGHYCHRNAATGWVRDKHVRDTGPFVATLENGAWTSAYHGTHAPVVIWYSPEMIAWLKANRPADGSGPAEPTAIPDGAIMVKEMFPDPGSACRAVDPLRLFPTHGAAIMIRDNAASHDGWFWGWYGFGSASGWAPDWPNPDNSLPNMGFAQYCMNCHASATDNLTFADLRNVDGEPGNPLSFLSQNFFTPVPTPTLHELVALPPADGYGRLGQPSYRPDDEVIAALRAYAQTMPSWDDVSKMPSETYDNTWVGAGGPDASDTFLTSSQCIGCHDAGSTGLQFDMTTPNPSGDNLINLSPYGTWRTSPMGLGGRDPIFFAQLASETQSFHPDASDTVQDTCLGCHGILGQRQYHIDEHAKTGECPPFTRDIVNVAPYPHDKQTESLINYGALARDGISCTTCHRMVFGADADAVADKPQNACVAERQDFLNPDETGFAKTFTGSFMVGATDKLIGPFAEPKTQPMKNALGNIPAHSDTITSSEVCGSCHTVHLPVMQDGKVIAHIYEQTTYAEWAFSAYRTGKTADGMDLPSGPGAQNKSCQDCHMPATDADGSPTMSRIASIQEHSNFPIADNALGADDIDLPVRAGFARHTLVGLNVFLVKMAQQFPDIFGIRTEDPMLVSNGVDPLVTTEQAMLDQAATGTASVALSDVAIADDTLSAKVTVTSATGHKFPSGVGFRRAFIDFRVLDQNGNVLWASGRTNAAGVIVDDQGEPIDGEFWWKDDCSGPLHPGERPHQPHFQEIASQSQAQIYQELVSTPPEGVAAPICDHTAPPAGELTTSFLSICTEVKDNRILPEGYLPLDQRKAIAEALGAGEDLAADVGATAVGDDPDYVTGGSDSIVYKVPLSDLADRAPATVEATLYYQATPPFFLQDRFCTAKGPDPERLYFLTGHLNLDDTKAESWKLQVASSGPVTVPAR